MKRFPTLLLPFVLGSPLIAQQTGIDQSSELLVVPAGDKFLHWYGRADRSYFLQVSDANNPLAKWFWAPVIEGGNDEEISYEVDGTASKGFFRLLHTTLPQPPGVTLEDWDADEDRLDNWEEITSHGSNPLKSDTDDDGLPDDWEIAHGLNVLDDGTEDPDRGPDAPFSLQPGGSQSAFAFAAPQSPLTNAQAFAVGVQAVPGATSMDKDGDLIPDEEDADPLSLAVNWRKSPKPVYAAIPVPGWVSTTHSFPVIVNNRNDVLTGRAVYQNGQWISINGHFSPNGSGPALSYQFEINGRLHPCHLGHCVVNSISDQGEIMGTGKILIDSIVETDPVTGQEVTYTPGYTPDFALIWRNPLLLPEIFGVAQGATLQGSGHIRSGMIHRDGTVLLTKRRPEDIFVNTNATVERWPNTANGGGVQTSPVFSSPSPTYPAIGGSFAFRSYLSTGQGLTTLSWIWPADGAPQSLYTLARSAPGAFSLNFQSSPTTIGTAPSGEACVNLSGQVVVGHSGRYHQVPSLQGATKISPHGAALLPGTPGNPAIWFGGSTYSLSSCVSNPQALGTTLTVRDVNDDGNMLAIINVNTSNQKLVILMPIDIVEVISDQIAGIETDKLPSPFFGGEAEQPPDPNNPCAAGKGFGNNPMSMGTRADGVAYVKMRVKLGSTNNSNAPDKLLVGMRLVSTREHPTENETRVAVKPAKYPDLTYMSFDPLMEVSSILPRYEAVHGWDENGDGRLQSMEVNGYFQKTPLVDSTGAPSVNDLEIADLIRIATPLHVDTCVALLYATTIGTVDYQYTEDLLASFITGDKSHVTSNSHVSETPTTILSNELSHPVGLSFNSAGVGASHQFNFDKDSELSNDVYVGSGLANLIENLGEDKLQQIIQAAPANPGEHSYFLADLPIGSSICFPGNYKDYGVDLPTPDSRLYYSIKKAEISGAVLLRIDRYYNDGTQTSQRLEVSWDEVDATLSDVYDFANSSDLLPRAASIIQAGSLGATPRGRPCRTNAILKSDPSPQRFLIINL